MLKSLSTRSKLLVLIVGVSLGTGAVGGIALTVFGRLERQAVTISSTVLPSLEALSEVKSSVAEIRFWSTRALILTIGGKLDQLSGPWAKREAARERGEKSLEALATRSLDPATRRLLDRFGPAFRQLVADNQTAWDAMRTGDSARPDAIMGGYSARVQNELAEPLQECMDLQGQLAHQIEVSTADLGRTSRRWLWGVLLASVASALILGLATAGSITRSLGVLADEARRLRDAVASGRLVERADPTLVADEFRRILEGVNDTMDAFMRPIAVTSEYVVRISRGDIPARITEVYEGDFNEIKDALNGCIDAVNLLVTDAGMLAKAGVEGRLATRADASRHQGDFRKVVQGVNDTLDAVVSPLRVVADYCERISHGDLPPRRTKKVHGDVVAMQVSLNRCVDAVTALVADTRQLAQAAKDGNLAFRADASKHEGAFRESVEEVNGAIDAIITPFRTLADYFERISHGELPPRREGSITGEYAAMRASVNRGLDTIGALVADTDLLAQAAVEGRLSARADVAKHQGAFRKIVEGVNKTLDAVMAPINEAAGVLQRLSERDLRARVTGQYQGDHAKIKESVNATGEALHDALAQVAQAVDQVSSASTQIAASSQAVASGASEQAASFQETTSSLASASGTTKQAADGLQQANQLAKAARTAAADGSAAVEQMQGAMSKIKASAEGTSQIIGDINDIAFQTNLLALNAAVEAARAGEAGRGFAVVAEEVRSLALRAKEAATKTEELIRQSVKEAVQGEVTAKHVAGKLGEIANGVSKVSDLVADIASGAQAVSTGIDQVAKAVVEMDKVTQQNAASAEESSSAASELSGQSEELAAMVAGFQLNTEVRSHAAAAPPRRALSRTSQRTLPVARRGGRSDDLLQAAPRQPGARNGASAHVDDAFPMDPGDLKEF